MSIEAVRVQKRPRSASRGLREPVGKTVLKNSETHQNVLLLFRSF
jgi:hypothetical protein